MDRAGAGGNPKSWVGIVPCFKDARKSSELGDFPGDVGGRIKGFGKL